MPKNRKQQIVLAALEKFPHGASADQINQVLGVDKLPTRTLQRRLASLIDQAAVIRVGTGRATKYKPAAQEKNEVPEESTIETAEPDFYPPISIQGQEIRNSIRKPIQLRTPVSYDRSFLDAYIPNSTFYLSEAVRAELTAKGKSTEPEQPAGTYARQIFNRLLIDLTWNSSRLEGNTYSLLETERLLEIGAIAEGKNELEAQMILNHKAAIEMLVDQPEELGFNRYSIVSLHALLSENLLGDPGACGRLRTIPVSISETVNHPLEIPQQIEECFLQILETASRIADPFEQAFFITVHLPYLQPFEDVNKRVSRLAANIPLIRENLSPLSFVDVPREAYLEGMIGVYELNRLELLSDVFVWAYERSCARYSAVRKSLGQPDSFRLRNRAKIRETVSEVVKTRLNKEAAIRFIKESANEGLDSKYVERFVEVVETELMALHEGNIARFRLRPAEYQRWKALWQ